MLNDPRSHGVWEVTAPPPATQPLSGDAVADVAIVGAGYTGCSTALHLAERGIDAAVLEAIDIGYGAAGRSSGLVNAGLCETRANRRFEIDAWVVLPDHMHCIWTLPPGDADFPSRWRAIKILFFESVAAPRGANRNDAAPGGARDLAAPLLGAHDTR